MSARSRRQQFLLSTSMLVGAHPARHRLAQDGLEQPKKKKGDPTIRIHLLKFTAASALVALTAASTPARANEMIHNLGPVGPHEPILATVGTKQVIAFYLPYSDGCAVHTVIWNTTDADRLSAAHSAERVRIGLKPGQIAHIDSADNVSLGLQCGDNAATLAVVDRDEHIVFGTSIPKHVKANASRF